MGNCLACGTPNIKWPQQDPSAMYGSCLLSKIRHGGGSHVLLIIDFNSFPHHARRLALTDTRSPPLAGFLRPLYDSASHNISLLEGVKWPSPHLYSASLAEGLHVPASARQHRTVDHRISTTITRLKLGWDVTAILARIRRFSSSCYW